MSKVSKETEINKKETKKVNLKTKPSSPRLEEETERPPQTLPKPVPFTWSKIRPIKVTDKNI